MFAILSNFFRFSLQGLNKSAESFSAFRRTLVNAGILENADEDLSDLFFQDIIDVFLIDVRVIRKELIHPVRMLFDISVGADILLVQDVILQKLHLLFQTGRKDRKTHYLDKADVLLLDVMAVLMRMVNAQGFPGTFEVTVTYTLTEENELKIHYNGTCDQDSLINMTNHSYFNLHGQDSGKTVEDHLVWIDADSFTPVREDLISRSSS